MSLIDELRDEKKKATAATEAQLEANAQIDPTPGSGRFEDQTCERVASLTAGNFSDKTICDSLLLDENDLQEIRVTETYLCAYAKNVSNSANLQLEISTTWNDIEHAAQRRVMDTLLNKGLCTPNYALAAARIANSAKRAGGTVQNPIGVPQTTVVLVLPQVIQQKLQNGTLPISNGEPVQVLENPPQKQIPLKRVDAMRPNDVHKLLDPKSVPEVSADAQVGGIDTVMKQLFGGKQGA